MYIFLLALPKYRSYTAVITAVLFIVLGILPVKNALTAINYNVIMMLTGTMLIVELFIESNMPSLEQIIDDDIKLKNIYSSDVFILKVDDVEYKLESQIIKSTREIIYLTDKSKILLYIRKGILEDCDYPANNSLYMMLLSGNTVMYGDDKRIKQEHIMTHQIYANTIIKNDSDKFDYYSVDITKLLSLYTHNISAEHPNNLFFTTSILRDYHYTKQKNNAYYHIQAINLPFQNIEFFYINCEEEIK